MGFFSNLVGGNEDEKALRDVFEKIRRVIEDEQFQLDMLHPARKAALAACPAYDRDPNGSGPFGFAETNPVPVNGPIGELAYLSRLETLHGERILFHRIGAIDKIDVFEAVTFSGGEWFILFLDLYHPRKSCLTPEGFRFTQEVGQFTGFHNSCGDFPYDFAEMKPSGETLLSLAYIPIGKVSPQIQDRVYGRPLAHNVKLDIVKSRLTSAG